MPSRPQTATDVKPSPKAKIDYLEMSPYDPYKGSLGYLIFDSASKVSCEKGRTFAKWKKPILNSATPSRYLSTYLQFEEGQKYLIDFNVASNTEATTFLLKTIGGEQEISYPAAGSYHLVCIVDATESGLSQIHLESNKDWWFYELEVTKLD